MFLIQKKPTTNLENVKSYMSYVQQYTQIIKMPTMKIYFSYTISKLKRTRSQITSDLCILNGKSSYDERTRSQITSDLSILNGKSSYDVTLFMCQSRSTKFRGILICVIFRPRDMQEYIFMFNITLEWR